MIRSDARRFITSKDQLMPRVTRISNDWLDNEGRFTRGKHKGESFMSHADYVKWILNETDVSNEDYKILSTWLERQ